MQVTHASGRHTPSRLPTSNDATEPRASCVEGERVTGDSTVLRVVFTGHGGEGHCSHTTLHGCSRSPVGTQEERHTDVRQRFYQARTSITRHLPSVPCPPDTGRDTAGPQHAPTAFRARRAALDSTWGRRDRGDRGRWAHSTGMSQQHVSTRNEVTHGQMS